MTVGLTAVLFVAAALVAAGSFAAMWRRDVAAALAGLPIVFAGAGLAFVGVARFSATGQHEVTGQELAVLLAGAAVALAGLGAGMAARELPR